jgi:hypothetical protein
MAPASCNEFITATFGAGALGMSVIARAGAEHNKLGNTIVHLLQRSDSNYPGPAERSGVRCGDAVVAVNQLYVAFLPHEETLTILKAAGRPIQLQFARPKPAEWARVRTGSDILSGILQKQAGWLAKWKPRRFELNRTALSYYVDGKLKRRMALSQIVEVNSLAPSQAGNDMAFLVRTQDDSLTLSAETVQEKMLWMHALDCAMNHAFDVPPVENTQKIVGGTTNPTATIRASASAGSNGAQGLRNGGAPPETQRLIGTSGPPVPKRPAHMQEQGVYGMLRYSNVAIAKPDQDDRLGHLVEPPETDTRQVCASS